MATTKKNSPAAPPALKGKNEPTNTTTNATVKKTTAGKRPAAKPAAAPKPKPGAKTAAPAKKRTAPVKSRAAAAIEELQTVGADVVPAFPVEVDAEAGALSGGAMVQTPDDQLSEAGPIINDTPVEDAPAAAPETTEMDADRAAGGGSFAAMGDDQGTAAAAQDDTGEGAASQAQEAVVEPEAIRDHTIDQIEPEAESQPAARSDTRPDTLLSDWDIHLFNEGTHLKLWEKLGNHIVPGGVMFGVWAPNAARVSVVGDFNGWHPDAHPMHAVGGSGLWEGFVPDLRRGATYKYNIVSRGNGYRVNKADPMAVHQETPPATASKVWDLQYDWSDAEWMRSRKERNSYEAPISIYEVHLGSWRRVSDDNGQTWRSMSYREIAQPLADYVKKMNFTHIELMPIQEHPFYGSWGYQGTGYYAPTSRYGTPQDFKYLVDVLHQNGIAVILDWVPSHFPSDEHGLGYFDGTHLYEHSDPRKGFQPDWGSLVFNYGRNEVRSFLLSNALYWLDEYHIDGLRVDAVASMLYLDYSRKAGEWIPNEFGGRENIEAISFLRRLNEDVYKTHPDVQVIAEESTAWPMVSRPTYVGGLGFGMKWDMGWMHDTLRYFAKDPVHRKFHHNDLTFRMMYAFTENFVLPLSHDEVVHGKGSLYGKMAGDDWQRAANLRLLFSHMYANPGKKLLFMGGELGQIREWNHDASLDWDLLQDPLHAGINRWLEDLNKAYRDIPALHELDMSPDGFEWIDCCDTEGSIVSLMRRAKSRPDEMVVVALNFTPMPRHNYQIGLPRGGHWKEVLNSDAPIYGGSGQGNMGGVDAAPIKLHGRRWSANLTLPPLGAVFLLSQADEEVEDDTATKTLTETPIV
jgi:1,4-alpha-glucan branching enzyme